MPDDNDKDDIIAVLRDQEAKMRRRIRELESAAAGHPDALTRARAEAAAEKEQELLEKHHRALNEAEVRARAARSFNDPDDAVRFLDLDALGAGGGRIEGATLDAAMADVLKAKPYLGTAAPAKEEAQSSSGANGAGAVKGDGGGGPRPVGHSNPDAGPNEMLRKMVHRR